MVTLERLDRAAVAQAQSAAHAGFRTVDEDAQRAVRAVFAKRAGIEANPIAGEVRAYALFQ